MLSHDLRRSHNTYFIQNIMWKHHNISRSLKSLSYAANSYLSFNSHILKFMLLIFTYVIERFPEKIK